MNDKKEKVQVLKGIRGFSISETKFWEKREFERLSFAATSARKLVCVGLHTIKCHFKDTSRVVPHPPLRNGHVSGQGYSKYFA